jgi:hypothetical protein
MHPEANPQTFEAPHREWLLSELAVVAVLNDPRIRTVVGMREKPYKEHRKIKIDGYCAPVVINQLYKQSIKNGRGYEWFLEEGMKLVKKAT